MEVIFSVSNDDILAENEPHNPLRADFAALREYAARFWSIWFGAKQHQGQKRPADDAPVRMQLRVIYLNIISITFSTGWRVVRNLYSNHNTSSESI
jgi:hypothetical protein